MLSLPGFVFSDAPRAPGRDPTLVAARLNALMQALGYHRYGVQGGDLGSPIARELGRLFPEHIVGVHLSLAPWLPQLQGREAMPEEERYFAARKQFDASETGYRSIQGTKPQTLAYAQHDSPIGVFATHFD